MQNHSLLSHKGSQ